MKEMAASRIADFPRPAAIRRVDWDLFRTVADARSGVSDRKPTEEVGQAIRGSLAGWRLDLKDRLSSGEECMYNPPVRVTAQVNSDAQTPRQSHVVMATDLPLRVKMKSMRWKAGLRGSKPPKRSSALRIRFQGQGLWRGCVMRSVGTRRIDHGDAAGWMSAPASRAAKDGTDAQRTRSNPIPSVT
jgi:hypothetical protein